MKRLTTISLALGIGSALGLAGAFAAGPYLPASPTVHGLKVAGQRLPDGADVRSWLVEQDEALRARTTTLAHDEHAFEVTLGELGVSLDVQATVDAALEVGHRGSLIRRLAETRNARRGEVDLPLRYALDEVQARRVLRGYAEALRVEPIDAKLDLAQHRKEPDVSGQQLDVVASVQAIREGFSEQARIALATLPVKAKITLKDLENIDVSVSLATFETHFSKWKVGRSANVALAAEKLNGLVIPPGETISFNERVGPRTLDRGFKHAPEIVGDELTIGVGGGTCQVSSTFFAAALHGGMGVVERRSHSRPSSYTKLGLDATVAYPRVDLKLRNPFPFPVAVHSFVPKPGLLRVELLGGKAVSKIEYRIGISRIEQFVRRITVKRWLKAGRAFRKQRGTRGMDVFSYVTIRFHDGRVEERRYYSGYRATPEVYWVASDYDQLELPDLPKHAKGVEGRMSAERDDIYEPISG